MNSFLDNINHQDIQIPERVYETQPGSNLVKGTLKKFTPIQIIEKAKEYFKYCIENPIKSKQLITGGNKGGNVVEVDKPRIFTLEGFCLWCGVNTKYFNDLEYSLVGKMDEESLRYSYVLTCVREAIKHQRIELAAANELNSMFVAKLLGLSDKVEHSGEIKNTVTQINFVQRTIEDTTFTEVQNMIEDL